MATANHSLPPPPRMVDYVSTLEGVDRIRNLATLHEDEQVVVIVSGCRPLRDAYPLLMALNERVQEGWYVIGLEELHGLVARAAELEQQIDRMASTLSKINYFLMLEDEANPGDAAARSQRVTRVLELPEDTNPPAEFTSTLVDAAEVSRLHLRRDFLTARDMLVQLSHHGSWHIIRRLKKQLAQPAATGAMPPQELWQDIQRQRIRHPPAGWVSGAAIVGDDALADTYTAPSNTSSDSD